MATDINCSLIAWRSIAGDINSRSFDMKRKDRSWLESMKIGLSGHPLDEACCKAKEKIAGFLKENKR